MNPIKKILGDTSKNMTVEWPKYTPPLTPEQIKILRNRKCKRCGTKGVSLVYHMKNHLCEKCLVEIYEGG